VFLSKLEHDILTTGKYLNVLRDCDTSARSPLAMSIPFGEGVFLFKRFFFWVWVSWTPPCACVHPTHLLDTLL